jgi:hypothetical protein
MLYCNSTLYGSSHASVSPDAFISGKSVLALFCRDSACPPGQSNARMMSCGLPTDRSALAADLGLLRPVPDENPRSDPEV